MELKEIGIVRNDFEEPQGPDVMRDSESVIEVHSEYEEGLYEIESNNFLQILFYLHLSEGFDLVASRRHGGERGVFASRSPHRPSPVGATVVKLLERNGSELKVRGLDAVNGTPVLDIKPYADPFDSSSPAEEERKEDPRGTIRELIERGDTGKLLLEAGRLHGHFCPYLSLGVVAAQYAVSELENVEPDMEDGVGIVETNSCFSDGIQYVTGCTFGNNALVYRDYGKTAFTLAYRDGPGIRLYFSEEDFLEEEYPEARELFEKVVEEQNGTEEEERQLKEKWREVGFDLVTRSAKDLFDIDRIDSPDLPDYAPIYEDEYCEGCGEKFMAPKGIEKNGRSLCRDCAGEGYLQLDGSGLKEISG
ncbi:tRNA (N6-threonylcarbamoyladenosine(37)-N6)-methyltransferase TrmO [Candidatus Bipolaricaulota bacterium]|nr:tRNA (N6-threonylcarbamoyladenosine(37)-N6)-methyltransferase TrmO [Candidatus Bipolaricaulota bacterium]